MIKHLGKIPPFGFSGDAAKTQQAVLYHTFHKQANPGFAKRICLPHFLLDATFVAPICFFTLKQAAKPACAKRRPEQNVF